MSTPIAEDLASDALQHFHADLRLALLMQHKARLHLLFRLQFPTSGIEPFHDSDDVETLDFQSFLSSEPPEPIASHGAYHKLLRAQDRLSKRAHEARASVGEDKLSAEQVAQLLREMHNFDRVANRLAARITASLTDIDELTGLLNRVAMERDLKREQAQARRTGHRFTLAIIDADHFKRVNDTYGHAFGDLVLESLAERFIASLRPRDAVYRYGGEEFLVLLPETTLDAATPVIERLRVQACSREMGDAEQQITQKISIGAAEVCAEDALDDAIERADSALYRAKQAGRNRFDIAFDLDAKGDWQPTKATGTDQRFRPCANYAEHNACNWVVPTTETDPLCPACQLNETIPDLSVPGNLLLWRRLQTEKNRLVYSLLRLGLAPVSKQKAPEHGLAFDFLGDPNPRFREDSSVMTGHAQGFITIDIAEADNAVREKVRQEMAEPYRTILGHFRHESGHYYWDRLVRDSDRLADFRACFGDERLDYDEALQKHYAEGPPTDWMQDYVSSYATAHPWEDWAETWAHYLHMVDTLETAWQFGLRLTPRVDQAVDLATKASFDPYTVKDFHSLTAACFPLTIALNSLNRSMGQADAYPFVLTPRIQDKLQLVHTITRG